MSKVATPGQQALWDALRAQPAAPLDALCRGPLTRPAVRRNLVCWVAAGHVSVGSLGGEMTFSIQQGIDPQIAPAATEDDYRSGVDRAATSFWNAMRGLPEFTTVDLLAHSATGNVVVTEQMAKAFVRRLLDAGYVRETRRAKRGIRPARYRLIRNTGPRPPVERRLIATYDPNEGRLTHVPEVTS